MSTEKGDVDLKKEVFTTFDVASICNANITSIKNWIEQGELEAHKTPGGHYRIQRKVLEDFLNRHRMPNPFAERERKHILALHEDDGIEGRLREEFGEKHRYASSDRLVWFLMKLGQWRPDAALVDDRIAGGATLEICESADAILELRPVSVIVVHERTEDDVAAWTDAGADYTVEVGEGDEGVFEAVRRAIL